MRVFAFAAWITVLLAIPQTGVSAQIQGAEPAASITPAMLHIPEGTQVSIRFEDALSSGSATVGDEFTITSAEPVTLPSGQVLPAGFSGKGEVTAAHKRGMMGKGGELSVRLDYLKIGSARVRLRGSKGGSGSDATGTTVALTVLFGPLGLLKHGHEMTIDKGQTLVAYVDQDIDVPLSSAVVSGSSAVP